MIRPEDFEGEVRDIATSLALELGHPVELEDGTRKALSTGEVSVRGMYGYV